jgi:hypothetical protein
MSRLAPVLRLSGMMALAALPGCSQTHGMQPPKTLDPGPSRASPTPGARNPSAAGPQGVLPNPHANPR